MKTRRWLAILFILVLCMSLVPGSILADGPGPITISESDLESILAGAAAAPMAGVKFSVEKVAVEAPSLEGYPENVYSFLSYTSSSPPDPFFPTPQPQFAVGDAICFNTYYAVLHHEVTGIRVLHVLFPPGGAWPDAVIIPYDDPEWPGAPGGIWKLSSCTSVSAGWVGNQLYFALVIPYDGDGNIFNREAIYPISIR